MRRRFATGLILWAALAQGAFAAQLWVFERPGCSYCAQFRAEIAPIYPKTTEGAQAPLCTVQIRTPLPRDVQLDGPVVFTPTFVLMDAGAEVARLEGYHGDQFFWPLLAQMLAELPAEAVPADPIPQTEEIPQCLTEWASRPARSSCVPRPLRRRTPSSTLSR